MKAYLVLDLSVNDFGGFKKYIAAIPAFIAKHSGKYLVQGVQPTIVEECDVLRPRQPDHHAQPVRRRLVEELA